MPVYLVERTLPGATLAQLAAIRQAAGEACDAFAAVGKPVRRRRDIFIPGESRCLCLFEAPNAALVHEVNKAAHLSYNRIIVALDLDS